MCNNLKLIFCISLSAYSLAAAQGETGPPTTEDEVRSAIERVVHAEELKDDAARLLDALPSSAVPHLLERIRHSPSTQEVSRLIYILTYKLEQFDSVLPIEQKRAAVDVLISQCETSTGGVLLQRLSAVTKVNDPRIDEMARRFLRSTDSTTRHAAELLIQKRATRQR